MTTQNTYDIPKKTYFAAEDTSFVSGDSPVTLDVFSSILRTGSNGYIKCDGAGDIIVTISSDGTNYGNNIRLKEDDTLDLRAISIQSIKITYSGTNSSYRVYVD